MYETLGSNRNIKENPSSVWHITPSSVGAGGYGCQGHSRLYTKFESENLSQKNEIVTSTQAVVDTLIRLKTQCYLSNFFFEQGLNPKTSDSK